MAGVQGRIPIRQPLEGGALGGGQALEEEEGARARKAAWPRVLHTITGRDHPQPPARPRTGGLPAKKWEVGLGQDHPLDGKVRGKINPLAGGSAPGSQGEVGTPRASGQVVSSASLFPTACGHGCGGHQRHGQARSQMPG